MDHLDILTLKSFILTLSQLPAISPELQTALQALPSNPKEMLAGIEDIIDQEPLATTYLKYQGLLQAREGKRNKSDSMFLPDDDEPSDEIPNFVLVPKFVAAIETQTPEDIFKKLPEIIQSPNPQQAILYWLGA